MPQSPALFRGQLYMDSQVHPRFSEAGTGVGGGEACEWSEGGSWLNGVSAERVGVPEHEAL